jgi:hypothetical protein
VFSAQDLRFGASKHLTLTVTLLVFGPQSSPTRHKFAAFTSSLHLLVSCGPFFLCIKKVLFVGISNLLAGAGVLGSEPGSQGNPVFRLHGNG